MDTATSKSAYVLEIIKTQLNGLPFTLDGQLQHWVERTISMLQNYIVEREIDYLKKVSLERIPLQMQLLQLERGLLNHPEHYLLQSQEKTSQSPTALSTSSLNHNNNNVFIVHGQDELAKNKLARMLEQLKLNAIILHEQINAGRTIIEKFENNASKSDFAVVLLTPDDEGYAQGRPETIKPRARQNVILELGYFCGALGRSKVCVLHKGDVEIPTDYLGVVYINMDDGEAWRYQLAKELKQAGLPIDMNNIK